MPGRANLPITGAVPPAALGAFDENEGKNPNENPASEAAGGFKFTQSKPTAKDDDGKGIDAQMMDCPVVVKDFHRHQKKSRNERWTRHR